MSASGRLLYVDLPFATERGGDKNRSRFIAGAVTGPFRADLLLLSSRSVTDEVRRGYAGFDDVFSVPYGTGRFPAPRTVYRYGLRAARIRDIVAAGRYRLVLIRFTAPALLAGLVEKAAPECRIAVDVDMLQSRIASLAWGRNRCFRNRFFLFETLLLRRFEKRLFNRPYLFFFSNASELETVRRRYVAGAAAGRFEVLPNTMPGGPRPSAGTEPAVPGYVLFFGALDSAANEDAYTYLAEELYPGIEPELRKYGMVIRVVGKNETPVYRRLAANRPRIEVVGPVEDMAGAVSAAAFCLLPIRIGSGTRTRILEAAFYGKTVVTTSIGVEGLGLTDNEVLVSDDAGGLVRHVRNALAGTVDTKALAARLTATCTERYSPSNVADRLAGSLRGFMEG